MIKRYLDTVYADPVKGQMLHYVETMLKPVDKRSKSGKIYPFRSRFGHTTRVLEWALRINEQEKGDAEILTVAAIFHDLGYSVGGEGHAKISERMFLEYAERYGLYGYEGRAAKPAQQCLEIAAAIGVHSDKRRTDDQLTIEQRILMDADLLDEAGAMSVLWSCFVVAKQEAYDFGDALQEIRAAYQRLQESAELFHTDSGRAYHRQMQSHVGDFIHNLSFELNLE